jgi:hypothetical protein
VGHYKLADMRRLWQLVSHKSVMFERNLNQSRNRRGTGPGDAFYWVSFLGGTRQHVFVTKVRSRDMCMELR